MTSANKDASVCGEQPIRSSASHASAAVLVWHARQVRLFTGEALYKSGFDVNFGSYEI
jgi:hypothetical protein